MITAKTRLIQGVGVNDANYCVCPNVNGKPAWCHFYRRWICMLERCYSAKWHSRQPTYLGCKVCDEWHSFMAFRKWMESQDWEGKELDKDLIGDGKLYSPENCVFISKALNSLFTDCGAARGEHPLGVSKPYSKYLAQIRVNGRQTHLGLFESADDAHAAWLKAKLEIANGFLENETNPRIRYAIECGIKKLAIQ